MEELVSAAQAASELEVDPRRIRAMIRHDQLEAKKIGGRWLIKRPSLERYKTVRPGPGRPFDPQNAWALLLLAAGREPSWLSRHQRSRLRSHLRGGLAALSPDLRKRASVHRLRAHPSDVARLAQEPRVVRSGASAAGDYGIDIYAPSFLEAYVPSSQLDRLCARYSLRQSDNPNVILRAVEDLWPFDRDSVAPPAVVAADLLEADDERSRRAAREAIALLGDQ